VAVGPAGVDQDHVALAELDALRRGRCPDVGRADRLAAGQRIDILVPGHVDDDPAGHDGRNVVGAQLVEPADVNKVPGVIAVVIHTTLAEVAKAVDLRTDAEPELRQVVVIGDVPAEIALQ